MILDIVVMVVIVIVIVIVIMAVIMVVAVIVIMIVVRVITVGAADAVGSQGYESEQSQPGSHLLFSPSRSFTLADGAVYLQ